MGLKGLHLYLGGESKGYLLSRLIKELTPWVTVKEDLLESARVLDTFYIPARYPDSHSEGAPFEHYGPLQSEGAMVCANKLLEFVGGAMGGRTVWQ